MTTLFKNNAYSRLLAPAAPGALTLTLEAGTGARFPAPGADTFFVTVQDYTSLQIEIMLCTARAGDVLTVTRAQEGTVAQNFAAGAVVECRLTAGMLLALQTYAYDQATADARFFNVAGDTIAGNATIAGTLTMSGASSSIIHNDGTINYRVYVLSAGQVYTGSFSNHLVNQQINNVTVAQWDSAGLRLGGTARQSSALLGAVIAGNSIEFGNPNVAGFRSVLGNDAGGGNNYVALHGEAGTNVNTIRTRGNKASIIRADLAGGINFETVASANADNQAKVLTASLSAAGVFAPVGLVDLSGAGASQVKFSNANNSANVDTLDGYKDYISGSPTIVGFGTVTGLVYFSKRVGDALDVYWKFTAGTPTAVEARIPLLLGAASLTADATKIPNIQLCGYWTRDVAVAESPTLLIESGVTYLTMGVLSATQGGFTKQLGNAIAVAAQIFGGYARVPISGW